MLESVEARRPYFRSMKSDVDGHPRCGTTGASLGVRPRDIPLDGDQVVPDTGGLSVTPDDPALMREEFRPEHLPGGLSRLPLFMIRAGDLGPDLTIRPDPRDPLTHHFFEPSRSMHVEQYQAALCSTRPSWRRER